MAYRLRMYRNVLGLNDIDKPTIQKPAKSNSCEKRNAIKGFSGKSKTRLHRLLERISHPSAPIFCTLTYHVFPDDWRDCKRHLDRFLKSLRRIEKQVCGVWRLEYQARGAPHFHLVLWAPEDAETRAGLCDERRLSKLWTSASCQSGWAAKKYACRVEEARNSEHVYRYLVGHHVKEDQVRDDIHSGRYWGVFGRDHLLGLDPIAEEVLTNEQAKRLFRFVAAYKRRARAKRAPAQTTLRLISKGVLSEVFIPYHEQRRLVEFVKRTTP